ncbi:lipid A biosynthesis lauroyl acyltransferase [Hartmannibacter diazotrophicus]|uniref:Lipid A biosynthesis lauroyl acyltransferase n=1 Tax=Hartmannibacter diazotrophicus TaxID=1482074 RepID=A0A2C9D457_9HYPH|nr:lipid A biosynthesis lauroyl acyltransferase [Hartmannibacter diazotrophicus]SON55074.1 lipid A biosynthesis lauroyl acyltransferase [Hartmannibacter diazotrophicus]
MRTKDRDTKLEGRKAWVYEAPQPPPLADLFGDGAKRRAFYNYHVRDNFYNGLDYAVHYGLKLLPSETCSRIGAWLGRFMAPRFHKEAEARARANLKRLKPDWSEAEVEDTLMRNWDNQGRLMLEFSVIHRLMDEGRITIDRASMEPIIAAAKAGPLVLVGLHIGNWEVLAPAILSLGISPYDIYMPQKSRARTHIAETVRAKFGLRTLPPGAKGARPALRYLKAGETIIIFCDEGFDYEVMAPFFHREPHLGGNLSVAVRLARHSGARIAVFHAERTEGCRFVARGDHVIDLPATDNPGQRLMEDVIFLNGLIEPIILDHLDQWYFLDNAL